MIQHKDNQAKAMPTTIANSDTRGQWKRLRDSVRAENVLLSTLLSTSIIRDSDKAMKQGIERVETNGKGKTWRVPPSA
jgi:hypothetical protein